MKYSYIPLAVILSSAWAEDSGCLAYFTHGYLLSPQGEAGTANGGALLDF